MQTCMAFNWNIAEEDSRLVTRAGRMGQAREASELLYNCLTNLQSQTRV